MIEIRTLPNYWEKSELIVAITPTKPTKLISTEKYTEITKQAISKWNEVLDSHSLNIKFHIIGEPDGTEDIVVKWWFSRYQRNGLTQFFPESGKINNVTVWISKCTGPEILEMTMPEESYKGTPVTRDPDQIDSAITHEFGHVLGLEHCMNFKRDLMFTDSEDQPDPKRKISNYDLQLIAGLWDKKNMKYELGKSYTFNDNGWQSVEHN